MELGAEVHMLVPKLFRAEHRLPPSADILQTGGDKLFIQLNRKRTKIEAIFYLKR